MIAAAPKATKRTTLATAADLLALIERLGGIDPARVRMDPVPGTATERDVIHVNDKLKLRPPFELVDRTLVEKAVAFEEPNFSATLIILMGGFVRSNKLGVVLPGDAMLRLSPGIVRLPDVSFISAAKYLQWEKTKPAVGDFGPDIAVEVLSKSNTKAEIARKRREYFASGTQLVWEVNPRRRTIAVYTAPTSVARMSEADTLNGGDVLPGFQVSIAELFAHPLR